MIPDEVEIRFWPLRVVVRGNRAINALKWPIAIALVTLTLTLGIALAAAGIFRLNEIQNLSGFAEPLTAPARDTGKRLGVARLLSASLDWADKDFGRGWVGKADFVHGKQQPYNLIIKSIGERGVCA